MTLPPPLLQLTDIAKSFGAVRALRSGQFELRAGEIHALAGENGAGKSTMMNIIDGILRPDSGTICIDGQPVQIDGPATAAQRLGIGFVHQEIALCADISVAENIFMAETARSRRRLMGGAEMIARAAKVLAPLADIDPRLPAGRLSISQQQLVEIAKALTLDCRTGRPGDRDHLHQPPDGRDFPDLRPRHGDARRPAYPHRPDS